MADTATIAPAPAAEPPLDRRRMVAFVCMVFGMFMAILDIQIVSASLAEIQAGLSASGDEIPWVQTSYLIAEVIAIPALRLPVAGDLDPVDVRGLGRRLHPDEPDVRDLDFD